jgi:hypothetical protein
MKKTMESAYTDMMSNLAKSTSAIPVHLQKAKGALAWWESEDSLLSKARIADRLEKSSHEEGEDEGGPEEAPEGLRDPRGAPTSENDVHGASEEEEQDEERVEDEEEAEEEAYEEDEDQGEMEKSLKDPKFSWHKQASAGDHNARLKFIQENPFPGTESEYHASRQAFQKKSDKMATRQLNKQAYNSMSEYSETGDPAKHKESIRLAVLAKHSRMSKALSDLDDISSAMLEKGNVVAAATPDDDDPRNKTAVDRAVEASNRAGSPKYNKEAVDQAIGASNRAGRKISPKGAKLIHRLLQGRHEDPGSINKSLSDLDQVSTEMLAKAKDPKRVGDSHLPGQMDMFGEPSAPKKSKLDGTTKDQHPAPQSFAPLFERIAADKQERRRKGLFGKPKFEEMSPPKKFHKSLEDLSLMTDVLNSASPEHENDLNKALSDLQALARH